MRNTPHCWKRLQSHNCLIITYRKISSLCSQQKRNEFILQPLSFKHKSMLQRMMVWGPAKMKMQWKTFQMESTHFTAGAKLHTDPEVLTILWGVGVPSGWSTIVLEILTLMWILVTYPWSNCKNYNKAAA